MADVKDKAPVLLEFEDNWGKPTESKAPEKPVNIALPKKDELPPPPEEDDEEEKTDPPELTPAKPEAKLSANLSAEFTVDGIDFIQSLSFRLINNRKIKRRIGVENIERFTDLLSDLVENKKRPEGLSESDAILFLKFKRLKQVGEDIPFSNEEHEKLTEAWSKYYQETGKSLPPWLGLSIAMADAIGSRLADAFTE